MKTPPESKAAAKTAWARIRRNLAILLGERVIFAVVNVIATGVATRATGLEAIGAIGLLHAYARVISDGVKFQSWQAVLRYGAPALESGRETDFRRLLKLTVLLDLGTALRALDRAAVPSPAPPQGLVLVKAHYHEAG